jgi:hypothetical protein
MRDPQLRSNSCGHQAYAQHSCHHRPFQNFRPTSAFGEAKTHSGLGELIDDPHHINEKDRGARRPELTLRESLFHGVQALRLNPNGDSNRCVSFKDYDAFLQAFQAGQSRGSPLSRA